MAFKRILLICDRKDANLEDAIKCEHTMTLEEQIAYHAKEGSWMKVVKRKVK
jgi:hypothetical protein